PGKLLDVQAAAVTPPQSRAILRTSSVSRYTQTITINKSTLDLRSVFILIRAGVFFASGVGCGGGGTGGTGGGGTGRGGAGGTSAGGGSGGGGGAGRAGG